jgi:hypothetical protein
MGMLMGMLMRVIVPVSVAMPVDVIRIEHGLAGLGVVIVIGVVMVVIMGVSMVVVMVMVMIVIMIVVMIVIVFLDKLGVFGRLALAASAILAHGLLRGSRVYPPLTCRGTLLVREAAWPSRTRMVNRERGHFRTHCFLLASSVLPHRTKRQVPRLDYSADHPGLASRAVRA